jgi:hypothetical protein
MKEYRNGFGVAYRELNQTADELETLLQKGEVRLSPEELKWRYEALRELYKIHKRIRKTLEEFSRIAPPSVRTTK